MAPASMEASSALFKRGMRQPIMMAKERERLGRSVSSWSIVLSSFDFADRLSDGLLIFLLSCVAVAAAELVCGY